MSGRRRRLRRRWATLVVSLVAAAAAAAEPSEIPAPLFDDAHLHLTSYIQQGPTMQQLLAIMGDQVGRVASILPSRTSTSTSPGIKVATYVVASAESVRRTAALVNRYPDRFVFGTDEVAPSDQAAYLRVFQQYEPLWTALTPVASEKVRRGNHVRLFDAARARVRAWEQANPGPFRADGPAPTQSAR